MVCKFHEVLQFVREYNLLNDLDDDAIRENFDRFPHACSWDKEIGINQVDCSELGIIIDKVLEVLNLAYEHSYNEAQIEQIAATFCEVFDASKAPKKPVAFVVVLLCRL